MAKNNNKALLIGGTVIAALMAYELFLKPKTVATTSLTSTGQPASVLPATNSATSAISTGTSLINSIANLFKPAAAAPANPDVVTMYSPGSYVAPSVAPIAPPSESALASVSPASLFDGPINAAPVNFNIPQPTPPADSVVVNPDLDVSDVSGMSGCKYIC
jgi:flagellar hook-length control protein FliK